MQSELFEALSINLKVTNLYELIGASRRDSCKTIKQLYKKKAKQLHPDKNMHLSKSEQKEMELELCILTEAYRILGDPSTRRVYDGEYAADHTELTGAYTEIRNADALRRSGEMSQTEFQERFVGQTRKTDVESFNEDFIAQRQEEPNDHGYEILDRTTSTDYVENVKAVKKPKKVFKKWDADNFNYAFEQQKKATEKLEIIPIDELDGYTPSGSGYSLAPVSSYNGLLIVGGGEYTQRGMTDYQQAFESHVNPESVDLTPTEVKEFVKTKKKKTSKLKPSEMKQALDLKHQEHSQQIAPQETKEEFFKREQKRLRKEKKEAAKLVKKFAKQYPPAIVAEALQGQLETSQSRPDSFL